MFKYVVLIFLIILIALVFNIMERKIVGSGERRQTPYRRGNSESVARDTRQPGQRVAWDSDEQIRAICEDPSGFARLYDLLYKYIPGRTPADKARKLADLSRMNDTKFYELLSENHSRFKSRKMEKSGDGRQSPSSDSNRDGLKLRAKYHSEHTIRAMGDVADAIRAAGGKYLDVGCGNGSITAAIADQLGLQAHGLDQYKDANAVMKIDMVGDDGKFPYADGSFNFISAFVSLHHMKDPDAVCAEIRRVLAPGGYVMIKENDCWNDVDRMLTDVQHMIYMKILKTDGDFNEGFDYVNNYRSVPEWNKAMALPVIREDFYWDKEYRDAVPPTRTWFAIYRGETKFSPSEPLTAPERSF